MSSHHLLDSHANTDLIVQWKVVDAASGEGKPSDKVHEIVYVLKLTSQSILVSMWQEMKKKKRWREDLPSAIVV